MTPLQLSWWEERQARIDQWAQDLPRRLHARIRWPEGVRGDARRERAWLASYLFAACGASIFGTLLGLHLLTPWLPLPDAPLLAFYGALFMLASVLARRQAGEERRPE